MTKLLFPGLAVLAVSLSPLSAHEDPNNVTHMHGGQEIYIEEYPNGTTYYSSSDGKFVFTDENNDGKYDRTDCKEDGAECREALEKARESGPAEIIKASYDGKASTAIPLKVLFPRNPGWLRLLPWPYRG